MVLLAFVLVTVALARDAKSVGTVSSCLNKNEFMAGLEQAKPLAVKVFQSPVMTNIEHCHSEWGVKGTCCDQRDVVDAFKLESKLIDINRKALSKLYWELLSMIRSTTLSVIQSSSKKNASDKLVEILERDLKIGTNQEFEHESDRCWGFMKQIRGFSWCSVCSGGSEVFFKNGKILISEETCDQAIDYCRGFFRHLSRVNSEFRRILSGYKNMTMSTHQRERIGQLDKKLRAIRLPKKLLKLFSRLAKQRNNTKKRLEAVRICQMIVNVRKTPFILAFNPEHVEALASASRDQIVRKYEESMNELDNEKKAAVEKIHKEFQQTLDKINESKKKALDDLLIVFGPSPRFFNRFNSKKNRIERTSRHEHSKAFAELNRKMVEVMLRNDDEKAEKTKKKDASLSAFEDQRINRHSNFENTGQSQGVPLSRLLTSPSDETKEKAPESIAGSKKSVSAFRADSLVVLVENDNMFTAVDGKSGTALDKEMGGLKPMNSSLSFP
jgi:flagellar biogenesis protein FliO